MLFTASYDEVLEELIKVRGLGKWSVEMFACFGLKRMDVFSTGDLGVQRGMAVLAGKNVSKLKASKAGKWKYMGEKEMEEMAEKFRPYRYVHYGWENSCSQKSTGACSCIIRGEWKTLISVLWAAELSISLSALLGGQLIEIITSGKVYE